MKNWLDFVYNAHTLLKDYYSYEELMWMPLRNVLQQVNLFTPRFKEIAKRQEKERLAMELQGKMSKPKGPQSNLNYRKG